MDVKKFVFILIAVVLFSFGVGGYSLIYNDNFNGWTNKALNITKKDSDVRIGSSGIEIKDGDNYVSIGWEGINIIDGDDNVSIGPDGINIKEGDNTRVSIGNWTWFNFGKSLNRVNISEEKLIELNSINKIYIDSSFVDIIVKSSDRENIKVRYYGEIKASSLPKLQIDKVADTIEIKLVDNRIGNYLITDSDLVLEIIMPEAYSGDLKVKSSSSNISINNMSINDLDIDTSSGGLDIGNIVGKTVDLDSSSGKISISNIQSDIIRVNNSSGEIEIEDSLGELSLKSISGNIDLDNNKNNRNIKIKTISGDIFISFNDDSSYTINGKSISGTIKALFPINIEKNSVTNSFIVYLGKRESTVDIDTSSGNIVLSQND